MDSEAPSKRGPKNHTLLENVDVFNRLDVFHTRLHPFFPLMRFAFFEKWFSNKIRAIHLEQTGSFGQRVEVAAKVDLTGMDVKNLVFYSYDKAKNQYKRIVSPNAWVDKNGYLHFTTELAGDIIISDGPLTKQ